MNTSDIRNKIAKHKKSKKTKDWQSILDNLEIDLKTAAGLPDDIDVHKFLDSWDKSGILCSWDCISPNGRIAMIAQYRKENK